MTYLQHGEAQILLLKKNLEQGSAKGKKISFLNHNIFLLQHISLGHVNQYPRNCRKRKKETSFLSKMSSQQQQPIVYAAQALQQQHIYASKRDSTGKLVCAGFTGGALSLLLTPLMGICGLCCFRSYRSRSLLFFGASFSTIIWSLFSFVCRNIAIGLEANWRLRNKGRVYGSSYYSDEEGDSVLCTETNAYGAFLHGQDNEYCEIHSYDGEMRQRDSFLLLSRSFLASAIVFFVIFAIYFGLGLHLIKKGIKK
jgi:hypothetical protein